MSLCLHKKETIHSSWLMYVLHTQSLQSCLTLCDPMDCSSPGSSVHGILQTRILKWVASFFIPTALVWPHNRWLSGRESACQCRRCRFNPWVGKIPWRRKWQPTPIFLSRKSHGQRSLVGYSPWGYKRVGHNLSTKQQPPSSWQP